MVLIKIGSVVRIPLAGTILVTSADQTIISSATAAGVVTLTALRPGTVTLDINLYQDLRVQLNVQVTPT